MRASKVKEVLELLKRNPNNITLQQEESFIDEVCETHIEKKEGNAVKDNFESDQNI